MGEKVCSNDFSRFLRTMSQIGGWGRWGRKFVVTTSVVSSVPCRKLEDEGWGRKFVVTTSVVTAWRKR
ncbi:MAG: hypothetical protein ACRC8Y_11320 [Chroococcales cyanobacterium]